MNYYKFHIGDYLTRTMHLPDAEDLAYRRLLDLYYITEKPLPNDIEAICRRVRLDKDVVLPVLQEFFEHDVNGWFNERCTNEILKYQKMRKSNVKAGQKSASVRSGKAAKKRTSKGSKGGEHDVERMLNTKSDFVLNQPNNQEPITNKTPITPFEEFWSIWPTGSRKINKTGCRDKWEAQGLNDIAKQILTHVRAMKQTQQWKEGFVPAPMTYINQSRWLDGDPNGDKPEEGVFGGRKVV